MSLSFVSPYYKLALASTIRESLASPGDGVSLGPTDALIVAESLEAVARLDIEAGRGEPPLVGHEAAG